MDPDLQRVVVSIQLNDYLTLVVLTTIVYDYVLTFSKEVEYIWTRPWTRVSTLFVLVRYVGLCFVILDCIMGSSFLPGPAETYVFHAIRLCVRDNSLQLNNTIGDMLFLFETWAGVVFFAALDLVMILRVWALYHCSRWILAALLLLYAVELVPYLIFCILLSIRSVPLVLAQVPNFSFCTRPYGSPFWPDLIDGLQIAFGALMCVLVSVRFVRQSVQMYNATKQYRLSRYFNALVKEGVVYFVAILVYSIITMTAAAANIPMYEPWTVLLGAMQSVPMFTLGPRFILNLRELYAWDLERRFRADIDTGFGLKSQFGNDTVVSIAGAFFGAEERAHDGLEELEQGEGEIRMEDREIRGAGRVSDGVDQVP